MKRECAAGCGKPVSRWQWDAEGRVWHPDCVPAGTLMSDSLPARIRRLEAELAKLKAQLSEERG